MYTIYVYLYIFLCVYNLYIYLYKFSVYLHFMYMYTVFLYVDNLCIVIQIFCVRLSSSRSQRDYAILRDIHTSAYQICRIKENEEKINRTTTYIIWLLKLFSARDKRGQDNKSRL